jgi:F-type H+-transporting ATPase subunit delta
MMQYCTDIVKIYAIALFDYAIEKKIIDSIAKEVLTLQAILLQDITLLENISAPIYSEVEQIQLLQDVINNLSLSKEMANLLYLLAKNKRLHSLMDILGIFNMHLSEYSGNKIVEATISYEFSKKEQDLFKTNLENHLSSKIELSYKIDPKILGGMIIKIDNKMLDASLRNKFTNLSNIIESKIALL